MRNINLKIDINKQNYIYEDAMQNDDITLQITLFENGTPYNLGTNTVTLNWLKADGTFVLINTTKEISITNNVVNIILPRDCTRAIGEVAFELSIKDTNGKQISTFPLSIEVIGSVLSGNKEPSKNLITSIEELENVIDNKINQANAKKTELDTSIANAQDDINTINSAGNRPFTIPSTAWVGTEPNLSYVLSHNLSGVNLIVGVIDDDTKLSSVPDYKSIDSMKIELYSTTRRNITVTINKSAYSGNDSEWVSQEVIDARDGEVSLKSKIDRIDTSINSLNNEVITARGGDLTLDERLDGVDLQLTNFMNFLNNGGSLFNTLNLIPLNDTTDTVSTTKNLLGINVGTKGIVIDEINNALYPNSNSTGTMTMGTNACGFKDFILTGGFSIKGILDSKGTYSSGTWTPVLYTSGSTSNIVTANTTGSTWVKIGNLVIAFYSVIVSSYNTAWNSQTMLIRGIPMVRDLAKVSFGTVLSHYGIINTTGDTICLKGHETLSDVYWIERSGIGMSATGGIQLGWCNQSFGLSGLLFYQV